MLFSIIVVSLNAGIELRKTIDSILSQDCADYEIIVKDGGSSDSSLAEIPHSEKIRIEIRKDTSIYDAMNQATKLAAGQFFLFLNCGDYFYQNSVLSTIKRQIEEIRTATDNKEQPIIVYGDLFRRVQNCVDAFPNEITDFVCYRNVPCHQVCFYDRQLFSKRGYDTEYLVRADYEHFLYCKYEQQVRFAHVKIVVASYEGGGFSETRENMREAKQEHRKITKKYLGGKCFWYRLCMIITLQPLRKRIADSKHFSGMYQNMKKFLYQKERKSL